MDNVYLETEPFITTNGTETEPFITNNGRENSTETSTKTLGKPKGDLFSSYRYKLDQFKLRHPALFWVIVIGVPLIIAVLVAIILLIVLAPKKEIDPHKGVHAYNDQTEQQLVRGQ